MLSFGICIINSRQESSRNVLCEQSNLSMFDPEEYIYCMQSLLNLKHLAKHNDLSCLHCVTNSFIDLSVTSVDLNDTSVKFGAQLPILSKYESLIQVAPEKLRLVASFVRYLLIVDSVNTVSGSLYMIILPSKLLYLQVHTYHHLAMEHYTISSLLDSLAHHFEASAN